MQHNKIWQVWDTVWQQENSVSHLFPSLELTETANKHFCNEYFVHNMVAHPCPFFKVSAGCSAVTENTINNVFFFKLMHSELKSEAFQKHYQFPGGVHWDRLHFWGWCWVSKKNSKLNFPLTVSWRQQDLRGDISQTGSPGISLQVMEFIMKF